MTVDDDRIAKLERDVAGLLALSQARAEREVRIEDKVDGLVAAENQRQGREERNERARDEDAEHRSQRNQWIRAFLPTGFLVGVWTALLWALQQVGQFINGQ